MVHSRALIVQLLNRARLGRGLMSHPRRRGSEWRGEGGEGAEALELVSGSASPSRNEWTPAGRPAAAYHRPESGRELGWWW